MMISENKYSTTELTKEIQKELAAAFDCGNPALSSFLSSYQALDDSFGKTYVMLSNAEIIGFSFISLASTEEGHYLYERNGFFDIEEDMKIAKNPGELKCTPMYLPLDYE